jgi:Leu/Phe-tRNA-protein transferase
MEFTVKLMEAGFLVMSTLIEAENRGAYYLMLPKLHVERSVLFFENLHIKKSIRKFLNRYELRADDDFDHIVERCLQVHGQDWLTPPLVDGIKKIRQNRECSHNSSVAPSPMAFGLYRDGKLVAGEFGIVCGKVYTSYSGYYDEDNAGTVQIILTACYLKENGFSFFDLGMPMDYKKDLGAVNLTPYEFVPLFRNAQLV